MTFAAMDNNSSGVLVFLDLSPAFDTVDHAFIITRLQNAVGLHARCSNGSHHI